MGAKEGQRERGCDGERKGKANREKKRGIERE